ncbi:MAG TPA: alpha/beta hydrolase [Chitinophaga sp.]|uniref:alpha/beta fold hydrolase n=1 Tax=Chitinophaga sp. TaxID=1869181 RepID=UPI002B557219|nr:alpha/beta hydrolase [Chitinophaga sp.]HVI43418.1 alpha/beta hydrolase [Chitinophaga sp.]
MKQLFIIWVLLLTILSGKGQSLYIKAFGKKDNPAVIFIHGGPGGNAVHFEATTAAALADRGFYVIVYDRRGEGRSADPHATFTYHEAFDDLNNIYKKYALTKASLIGFSFGGLVSTLYTQLYPEKVRTLVLTSALFSQQATYDHILDSVNKMYAGKHDTAGLSRVTYITALDKRSAAYRKGCFDLAGDNGFFRVASPDVTSRHLDSTYKIGPLYKDNIRNPKGPEMFYRNEKLTNINVLPILEKLTKHVNICALYGRQDGIFSVSMLNNIKRITGEKKFRYLDNCSHYLYADQQGEFLSNITRWLK